MSWRTRCWSILSTARSRSIGVARIGRLHDFLTERIKTLPRLRALAIYGSDGQLLVSSLADEPGDAKATGQAFFEHHRGDKDAGWYFGPYTNDPLDGGGVLTISRRFDTPGGGFGGVVVASVELRYFSDYFSRFEVGRDGSLVLFTASGILVARYPVKSEVIGETALPIRSLRNICRDHRTGLTITAPMSTASSGLSGYRRGDTFPLVALAAAGR